MPLPDERPRQSVANLIGRFEQQTKRQSVSGSPRSVGVVSHDTGDSIKEEVKEKREWPLKAIASNDKRPLIIPSSSWSRRNASLTSTSSPPSDEGDLSSNTLPPPKFISSTPASPSPAVPKIQRLLSVGSAAVDKAVSPPALNIPSDAVMIPARPKTPTKTPIKSPKLSLGASTPQPVRPQHTGQSATSTSSRHAKPVPKVPPFTPSRSKESTARPKTPSNARPKTPASGLFAPTAASLAKARNAPPQLPTPTKKVTLSSSSADRLSKPTAASLARSANAPASLARSMIKTSASRGGEITDVVKTRVGLSPAKMVKQREKAAETKAGHKVAAVVVGTASATALAMAADREETGRHENGHGLETSESTESAEAVDFHVEVVDDALRDELEESHAESETLDESEDDLQEADASVEPDPSEEISTAPHEEYTPEPEHDTGSISVPAPVADPLVPSSNVDQGERLDEVKHRVQSGNDIEDIVNLLESRVAFTNARPKSIATIPDDVDEIPDEE